MYNDKCPTCPKWGTGMSCDCGRSKYQSQGLGIIGLFALGFITGALIFVIAAELLS